MRLSRGLVACLSAFGLFTLVSQSQAAVIDVTQGTTGSSVAGVWNTGAGGANHLSTVGTANGQYPSGEAPIKCIDDDSTTKYLNFGKLSVGLVVTPVLGPTIVSGLTFQTGGDAPERDPITYTLEGSNDPNALLEGNSSWTLIASGTTGLTTDPGRSTLEPVGVQPAFSNLTAYTSYRLLFTSVRNAGTANSMQIGEIQLLGNTVPEPASVSAIAAVGALALLRRRRA